MQPSYSQPRHLQGSVGPFPRLEPKGLVIRSAATRYCSVVRDCVSKGYVQECKVTEGPVPSSRSCAYPDEGMPVRSATAL